MSFPFFYEADIRNNITHFTLSEETSKHCIQVLRMKTGEQLQLTNGLGLLCTASIASEDKKKAVVTIDKVENIAPPSRKISIAISLLKNASRFEWLLEKVTEIGVTEIIPIISGRTEHTRFRHDRMNGILISAMLQSQQTWLPVLSEPMKYETLVKDSKHQQKLIAHCEENNKQLIPELAVSNDTQILIGPEGDFTPAEIQLAVSHDFLPVSLGDTRLRTETAGMVAAVLLVNRR